MMREREFWNYGDKWSKICLRLPPAKSKFTFILLTIILFMTLGAVVSDIYGQIIGLPRVSGNKGGNPMNPYYLIIPLTYLAHVWRYTAPLSIYRYRKDAYGRPAFELGHKKIATFIALLLFLLSFLVNYFLFIYPKL